MGAHGQSKGSLYNIYTKIRLRKRLSGYMACMNDSTQPVAEPTEELAVPSELFNATPNVNPNAAFPTSLYAPHSGSGWLLAKSVTELGVTAYQLSRLLGCKSPNTVPQWKNGSRRPAQIFLVRLFYLFEMRRDGVPLVRIRRIDWDTGQIIWRAGNAKNADRPPVA